MASNSSLTTTSILSSWYFFWGVPTFSVNYIVDDVNRIEEVSDVVERFKFVHLKIFTKRTNMRLHILTHRQISYQGDLKIKKRSDRGKYKRSMLETSGSQAHFFWKKPRFRLCSWEVWGECVPNLRTQSFFHLVRVSGRNKKKAKQANIRTNIEIPYRLCASRGFEVPKSQVFILILNILEIFY